MVSGPEPDAVAHDPTMEVLHAFKKWLAKESFIQTGNVSHKSDDKLLSGETSTETQAYFTPRAAPMSISDHTATQPISVVPNNTAKTNRSVVRRVLPTIVYGLIAVSAVIAVLEGFPGSHGMPGGTAASRGSATALLNGPSQPSTSPTSDDPNSTGKPLTEPASSPKQLPTPSESGNASEEYGAIQRQIEAVSNELTTLREIVEKFAATQQTMSADIAALKASEENIYLTLSRGDTKPSPSRVISRRAGQNAAKPQATGRPPSAQGSSPSVGPPLPLR
jgi:hypothetical protein